MLMDSVGELQHSCGAAEKCWTQAVRPQTRLVVARSCSYSADSAKIESFGDLTLLLIQQLRMASLVRPLPLERKGNVVVVLDGVVMVLD